MSKSLGNTVSPELMIQKFGADTIRLFILFAANPTAGMDWSDQAPRGKSSTNVTIKKLARIYLCLGT